MKALPLLITIVLVVNSCQNAPAKWDGPELTDPRNQITVNQLLEDTTIPLVDMSFFAEPEWATEPINTVSGIINIRETELIFPKEKAYYPGENLFPNLQIEFLSHEGSLIPLNKDKIITKNQSNSYWDVVVGTGKIWHEETDGAWSRASFPLTLTDRWMGQARNCVATFVYKDDTISNIFLQSSQETADIDDRQLGNISGILPARFQPKLFADSATIIEKHKKQESEKLPTAPLSNIDSNSAVAGYFKQMKYTNAPTSLGAVWMNDTLYLHPPQTRHGLYPYPGEMRHGLYSVTKSLAGALALLYFEERYEDDLFSALITDYVPALANHDGWQGVTFSHTLNMVTGTIGGEDAEHLFSTLIVAETAEEAINNIALLGDAPPKPGEKFNYASTNFFVLSYALQKYVEEKEGKGINYWDLVHNNVLVPIGAAHFSLLHTMETNQAQVIPRLAYGALPTIDEAAKIALLFAKEGKYKGRQLLNKEKVKEIFGKTGWKGHSTHNDFRGSHYQHSFWAKEIGTGKNAIKATYMLGFGENYIVFLPGQKIIFRFLDEHDLNIDKLIKKVEKL